MTEKGCQTCKHQDLPDHIEPCADPRPEQGKYRICRRCGLIQKIDYFMFPDGVWLDEGYGSIEQMLTAFIQVGDSKEVNE